MMLPVLPMRRPSSLVSQSNGELADHLLADIGGARLHVLAARSWRAMCAAASAAGFDFAPASVVDGYRTLQQQTTTFLARYTLTPLAGRPTRLWNGRVYWLRWGFAPAATPGTSNHGWGLALDIAMHTLSGAASITPAAVAWLVANAHRFGWSAEVQSESWHWRAVHGDVLPLAVVEFETPPLPAPPPPTPAPDEGDDMTTVMLAPVGEPARFLADLSRQGVALTCLWTGPGDDPKVAAKLEALRRLGVAEQPCHRSDLGNVTLLGAVPPGWSPSDFAGHVA